MSESPVGGESAEFISPGNRSKAAEIPMKMRNRMDGTRGVGMTNGFTKPPILRDKTAHCLMHFPPALAGDSARRRLQCRGLCDNSFGKAPAQYTCLFSNPIYRSSSCQNSPASNPVLALPAPSG